MSIRVFNEELHKSSFTSIYVEALKRLELEDDFDIDITFVSKEEIAEVNKRTRKINSYTDVLSFPFVEIVQPFQKKDYPFDINPETGNIYLGEILICDEVAKKQAIEYGHSYEREINYLFTHGLLHLFGYDHQKKEDKKKMREMEEEIMKAVFENNNQF